MIPVSDEYKRQLIAGNRNWVIKIPVFLESNTSMVTPDFTLTNEEVWDQGVVIDQATSSDNSFDLGSAIVGSLKVVIDNITGHFSTYDFYNAKLVLYLGVEGDLDANDEQVYYRIGFYTVDEPSYNGSLITLNCLDNMTWFDLPFSEVTGASFPTTAGSLVAAICARVGVTLGTVSFPNYTTVIPVEPDAKLNCREVLQYVAQMCCCYCKIDRAGQLILAWYDKTAITGLTDYDGGYFGYDEGGLADRYTEYKECVGATTIQWELFYPANIDYSSRYRFKMIEFIPTSYPAGAWSFRVNVRIYDTANGQEIFRTQLDHPAQYYQLNDVFAEITTLRGHHVRIEIQQVYSSGYEPINFKSRVLYALEGAYASGDSLDGGDFRYSYAGDSVDGGTFTETNSDAWLSENYQMEVSTDDIVVTGCRVRNSKTDDEDSYDELYVDPSIEEDHGRYVLVIEDNPFITKTNASVIASQVGVILAGLPIRAYTATSLADFSYETGDMVRIYDFRGNLYYSWITKFTFTTNNSEQFGCGAQSVKKRNEERFSGVAKTLAEAEDNAKKLLTTYDNAVMAMNELAQNAIGYSKYFYPDNPHDTTGRITWLYNGTSKVTTDPANPLFPDSTVVFKISGDGVFISNNGGMDYTQGYDANSGTAILSLLYAIGISCDWIHAGELVLGGANNKNGVCSVLNASGSEKVRIDNRGIEILAGRLNINDNFIVSNAGNVTVTAGMFSQYGDGYLHLAETSNSSLANKQWQFDLGQRKCNCMYKSGGTWHWVNDGAQDIYKYLQGAYSPSDKRYKKDIEDLDDETTKRLILGIEPCSFRYTYDDYKINYGMLAQDVKAILDELDFGEPNGLVYVPDDETEDMWSIEYKQFVPFLIKMAQIQQAEIDELKKELAELKAR